jgi:signal transduction histidine kinase
MFSSRKRRELAVDIAIALAAFLLTLFLLIVPEDEDARSLDAYGVLLAALTTLPLVARRRAPLAVFTLTTLASATLYALEYPGGPPVGPTLALYFVALSRAEIRGSTRLTLGFVLLMLVVHVSGFSIQEGRLPFPELVLGLPLWGAAWFAGDRTRLRRERIAELEDRAERAEREAERERRLAAAEERTRIARDLHDSAGHAINVILVQAGAARLLSEKDPARSRRALATIETVARETLREIDQLVRALREDADAVEPPTGLAALDTLVNRHRDAGLDVGVSVRGTRRPLGPAVDQAAYRILQESLTNALRHGRGGADVTVTYGDNALELGISNATAGNGATAEGHGLVGMRERAALIGGSVETDAVNGVFQVRARLPYGSEETH